MKTDAEVSQEKLRGGFYSPPPLVNICLDRLAALLPEGQDLRLLEPSAGDGAFLRGLADHTLGQRVDSITAIEPFETEADKCKAATETGNWRAEVLRTSAVSWAADTDQSYDVAVGNPPFVRFQFVSGDDKKSVQDLGDRLGLSFGGVSNLWLPVLLGSLSRIRAGGAFAFIIPAECFTGISAGVVRNWLLNWVDELRFDLFQPGSFPGVLQEVVVASGRLRPSASDRPTSISIADQGTVWHHTTEPGPRPWTRYLLTSEELDAYEALLALDSTRLLGEVARFGVSTVTGANTFFSVGRDQIEGFGLETWATPLLPRIRNAPGLRLTAEDHEDLVERGDPAFLLNFASDRPSPEDEPGPADYLTSGEQLRLHERYKCRIRTPWYRVPVVPPGELLLSKRSHRFPRLVKNDFAAVTTDTIYRGSMLNGTSSASLTAAFHNTGTLLSAEMEGRSFGGGVLELVPSEIARLVVFAPSGFGTSLRQLDELVREVGPDDERLVEQTDQLLVEADVGLSADLLETLRSARTKLQSRRLSRN